MASIRTYEGEIRICTSCGQPAYYERGADFAGWMHFDEQWDGIHCPMHPLADEVVKMKWDEQSLEMVKELYPDTYPRQSSGVRHRAV